MANKRINKCQNTMEFNFYSDARIQAIYEYCVLCVCVLDIQFDLLVFQVDLYLKCLCHINAIT